MNKNTILRTSAVLYAEGSKKIDPTIIKRKMIESIFLEIDNKKVAVFELVDYLKKYLELDFTEEEIVGIINLTDEGYFDIIPYKESSKTKVQLTSDRYKRLVEKVESLSFDDIIELFGNDIYIGEIKLKEIKDILHRYVYFLMNTNHNTLTKILSGKHSEGDISLCESDFTNNERDLINQFISWDNTAKNKSLFMLISYSIEYCLVVNKSDSQSFLNSIKDKIFYLDNSIIYRALGINGETRQNRIISFLDKCIENGQTFSISKHTNKEFNDTIKHHIKHLKNLPAAKINPEIFELFNLNGDVAKFYYSWKAGRNADSAELFQLHVSGIYNKFIKKYNITVDKKVPYDTNTEEHKERINELVSQIENEKQNGQYGSHEFDAENVVLIDFLRNGEDSTLEETKIYFISTDQRLRNWDYSRSEFQPTILLPSHWMSLLLRYFSRSDSDYKAFTSFLKLKNGNSYLKLEHIDQILTGISNITHDFESQAIVAESMLQHKFDKILDGLPDVRQIEEIEAFAEKELDIHYKRQKEKNIEEKDELTKLYEDKIKRIEDEKDEIVKQEKILAEIEGLTKLEDEKRKRRKEKEALKLSLFKQKLKLDRKAVNNSNWLKGIYFIILIVYIITMMFLVNKSEFFSRYWSFISLFFVLVNYVSVILFGKTLDPIHYFSNLEETMKLKKYEEYEFDIGAFKQLDRDIKELNKELEQIKRTITFCKFKAS
jgi:hypothetical protein